MQLILFYKKQFLRKNVLYYGKKYSDLTRFQKFLNEFAKFREKVKDLF